MTVAIVLSAFQEGHKLQVKRESGLPKSVFPCIQNLVPPPPRLSSRRSVAVPFPGSTTKYARSKSGICSCSLIENPVMWVTRVCVYYALFKAGLVGSQPSGATSLHLGFSNCLHALQPRSSEEKEATNRRKLVRNWHPTTKGTLKRSYRVPSNPEGRRLLKAITSILSDDDEFLDATSHKGCQIRRESAHGESVCCNNVRALFDELPTPHLVLEITPFPAGPLSEKDYIKAGKLEKVLRSGTSI